MANPNREDLKLMCELILATGRGVTKWELAFIKGRLQSLDYGQSLAEAEIERIEQIYAERTLL